MDKCPTCGHVVEKENVDVPYEEIIGYLNKKTGKAFRSKAKSYRTLIKARWQEFPDLDVFKKVIDVTCEKWGDDPEMSDYLQPSTLFRRSNFESYTNWTNKSIPKKTMRRTTRPAATLPQFMLLNGGMASKEDVLAAIKKDHDGTMQQVHKWMSMTQDERDRQLNNKRSENIDRIGKLLGR